MKIGSRYVIICDWVMQPLVGMQRFALQILKRLDNLLESEDIEVILLIPRNADFPITISNMRIEKKGFIKSKVSKYFWEQVVFPLFVKKNKAIGIDMTSALPVFGCKIYTIHDCIHYLYPENFNEHKLFLMIQNIKLFLCTHKKKKKIISVSATSAKDISKIYNVPEKSISIIYNGWEHLIDIKEDSGILDKFPKIKKGEYYLSIGSKYKHKNYKWIWESAKINQSNQFVIVGTDCFANEDSSTNQSCNVIQTGYITDGELKCLIINCRALILPSYYEGFGIPPLEALALRKPIIVSNVSCLSEIYKDCAHYIDPDIPQTNIDKLLTEDVCEADELLDKYSWENASKKFLEILKEVKDEFKK